MEHRRHEFDTLIAASLALAVALAACWLLAHIVPAALAVERVDSTALPRGEAAPFATEIRVYW